MVGAWAVFVVMLVYASGLPVWLATILQQTNSFPEQRWFFQLLFPLGAGQFKHREDGSIDLVTPNYFAISLPWFLSSVAWEAFMIFVVIHPGRRPKHVYRINDTISSLSTGILFLLVGQITFLQWGPMLYKFLYTRCRLTDAFHDPNGTLGWWLCLLMSDVLYYVMHRSSHYISWLWTSHSVHHSSEEYNLSTALRQPANDFLTFTWLLSQTTMAFFFPPELAILHGQLGLLYQFWIHTQLVPPLPTVELIFNTASLHRIHHARNLRALGKNYGSIFSVWDRLGGTLEPELSDDGEDLYYGTIPPLNSWNPCWANLQHWQHMLVRQRHWHGWQTPFVHWTPPGGRCPRLGSRLNPLTKFEGNFASHELYSYALLQFLLVVSLVAYLELFGTSKDWYRQLRATAMHSFDVFMFLGAAAMLSTVASLQSANETQVARRSLMANGALHIAVAAAVISFSIATGSGFSAPAVAVATLSATNFACVAVLICRTRDKPIVPVESQTRGNG